MKIQIKSLRAVNIGPLKDVTLDFTDPSGQPRQNTLIGGANGNGKTTVLELIFGLLELLDPTLSFTKATILSLIRDTSNQYAHIALTIDEVPFTIYYGEAPDDVEITGEYVGARRIEGLWLSDTPHGSPNMAELLHLNWNFFSNIQYQLGTQSGAKLSFCGDLSMTALNMSPAPSILFFPHSRVIKPTQGTSLSTEDTLYQWAYRFETVNTFNESLNGYLVWLEYSDVEEYHRVITFLSKHFDDKKFGIHRKTLSATVTARNGQTHKLDGLSSGEQNLLILLLELRRRLLPNSIVLIDEIENSLHPAFQYKIGEALKEMQREIPFQLIVTSHAPAILKVFGSENTLLLPNPQYYDTANQAAAA
ncbi:MAG: AAA family ATPase [Capsulimonas sp.]|uniref:AAA family ATPase n=1 Tax=Capsulimonas sp. TaxID=2494211 RepID=UPI003266F36D